MDLDVGAAWMKVNTNSWSFCDTLGPGISVRQQLYSVFAYNASMVLDPDNKDHLKEIAEANDIQEESLIAMRWVKPLNCQDRPDQQTAHLILTFSSVDNANRAILTGLTICQCHIQIAKPKKEPL